MSDDLGTVEEAPEKVELEKLKDEYRRKNKALDAEREILENDVREHRYSEGEAEELSRRIEGDGRQTLDEVQRRIDTHCRAHGLTKDGAFSGTWHQE